MRQDMKPVLTIRAAAVLRGAENIILLRVDGNDDAHDDDCLRQHALKEYEREQLLVAAEAARVNAD